MARNLVASQEYIKWDSFYTITCYQKDTPGTSHVNVWVRSKKWTREYPGYGQLSSFEWAERDRSMEQYYGVIVFCTYMEICNILIKHIRDHLTCFGANFSIFSCTEYQKDSGNLPHKHGILALDREAMKEVNVQSFLADQIRTSAMEAIKMNEIKSLIHKGLLTHQDQY